MSLSSSETARLLEEVAACIDAQISISTGLSTLETRDASKVGRVAKSIRGSIESGAPIDEALSSVVDRYGPHVRSALRLGMRSGKPGEALRMLARIMTRRREMRLRSIAAGLYPWLVALISYAFLVVVFAGTVQVNSGWFEWPAIVEFASAWLVHFWWFPPLVIMFIAVVYAMINSRMNLGGRFYPTHWSEQSLFCEAMAWQLEADVPLPEAIRTSASFAGSGKLVETTEQWARLVETGQTPKIKSSVVQPLILWTVHCEAQQNSIIEGLRRLAKRYEQVEMRIWSAWTRSIPAVITCVIGSVMSIAYIAAVIVPLYYQLAGVK